jgi:hypothetical protein
LIHQDSFIFPKRLEQAKEMNCHVARLVIVGQVLNANEKMGAVPAVSEDHRVTWYLLFSKPGE